MAADYYIAETENGDHVDDPSEDSIWELIADLNDSDNTFITIEPATGASTWYAAIGILESGGYEVITKDAAAHEHEVTTSGDPDRIAQDLTIWLARRRYPGKATRASIGQD